MSTPLTFLQEIPPFFSKRAVIVWQERLGWSDKREMVVENGFGRNENGVRQN